MNTSDLRSRIYLSIENLGFSRRLEMRYLRRFMRAHLAGRPQTRGIDIASGLGNLTKTLSRVSRSAMVGIDFNVGSVSLAHSQLGSERIRFVPGDSHTLPLKDASFDFAVSVCAFEHFRNDQLAMQEVHRVLRPNGYFFLTVDSLSHPHVDAEFRAHHTRDCYVCQYYGESDIQAKLERAGFDVVNCQYLLKGSLASRLSRFGLRTGFDRNYLLLSALLYPAILMQESVLRRPYGYKLGVTPCRRNGARTPPCPATGATEDRREIQ